VLGYGLNDRGSRVRFLTGAGNFSLHHRIQNGSGAHPASYPMGIRGSVPGSKAIGRKADHSPPSSAEVKECVELSPLPQYAFMAWCLVNHRDKNIVAKKYIRIIRMHSNAFQLWF
jgi:hypothetical protein